MECGAGEKVTVDSRSVIMCKVPKKKTENVQD
jgi:hypothetical protein